MSAKNNHTSKNDKAIKKPRGRLSREANKTSRSKLSAIIWGIGIVSVLAILTIGSYLFLNRPQPITELTIAAGPYKSDSYELVQEIADVVSRQSEFLRIKVQNTKDSSENITILNMGVADLATIRSDTPVVSNIRMVANLFPDYFQLIAGERSGITTINAMRGKTVAIPEFGTDEFRSFWAIADHYDISATTVKWKSMPFTKASNALLSGEIDAIFTVRSLRDRLILNLYEDASLKDQNLRLIEVDQADAISIKRPFLRTQTIPKGTYSGSPAAPARDILSTSVTRNLVSRDDIEPYIIRELTRILFENRLDLVIRFSLASAIQKPDIDGGTSVPLHEGAESYYNKDEPSFLQENAEPIALMITIAAMIFSGLLALRSRFMSGQKNRMDSYNYMLLDIADQARVSNKLSEITGLKEELYSILEKVVRALDTDEVTEEGFQSFSLLWESVREVLNDRKADLT
ncbi:MAG: TAXI family TRAP transporter solute-binding subunit [Nitratireductor sp.]